MNTKYDKAMQELLDYLTAEQVKVVWARSENALQELAKRNAKGELKLPAVVFYRTSGTKFYLNEAQQSNLVYEGSLVERMKIDKEVYCDVAAYRVDLPYTIIVLANRAEEAWEFLEELIIKIKMYPALNISAEIEVPYKAGKEEKKFSNRFNFQAAVNFPGGGSGVLIEDTSEAYDNFPKTAGLHLLSFDVDVIGTVFKFKVRNLIVKEEIRNIAIEKR